jgi:hypothetical protein
MADDETQLEYVQAQRKLHPHHRPLEWVDLHCVRQLTCECGNALPCPYEPKREPGEEALLVRRTPSAPPPPDPAARLQVYEAAVTILTAALLKCMGEDYDVDWVVLALNQAGEVLGRDLWPEKCSLCDLPWEECNGH